MVDQPTNNAQELCMHDAWFNVNYRGVNGSDRIGFAHTISFTIYIFRIRIRADIDRVRIRMRMYPTADSSRKWSGIEPETKNSRICALISI
jgi:hypothetical protein